MISCSVQGNSSAALAQTKTDYDTFLGDAANLQAVREALQDQTLPAQLRKTLEIMQKTFLCYITEDPKATAMKVSHTQMQTSSTCMMQLMVDLDCARYANQALSTILQLGCPCFAALLSLIYQQCGTYAPGLLILSSTDLATGKIEPARG